MSVVKPYLPVLIMRSGEAAAALAGIDQAYIPALALRAAADAVHLDLVQHLINGNRHFLLLLDVNQDFTASATLDTIRLCMFSKNYVQLGGSPVVAFMGEAGAGGHDSRREMLVAALQLQGWPSVVQWHLAALPFTEQLRAGETGPLLLSSIPADEQFVKDHYLTDLRHIGNHLFFEAASLREALRLEQDFFALCSHGIAGNRLLEGYLAAKSALDELTVQHGVLQERYKSAARIIEVIRYKYKDDYNELFTWYHNEYEVLPLWYKRFGHIIKVITGKRTLQSLFRDNVKKYKD